MTVQVCSGHGQAILFEAGRIHFVRREIEGDLVPVIGTEEKKVPSTLVCGHCWRQVPQEHRYQQGNTAKFDTFDRAYGQKLVYVPEEPVHGPPEFIFGGSLQKYPPRAHFALMGEYKTWSERADRRFVGALIDFFLAWRKVTPKEGKLIAPGVMSVHESTNLWRPYFDAQRWRPTHQVHCATLPELKQFALGKLEHFSELKRPEEVILQGWSTVKYYCRSELDPVQGDTWYSDEECRKHSPNHTLMLESWFVDECKLLSQSKSLASRMAR